MDKKQTLQKLSDSIQQFPEMWASCKQDPANMNNLYALVGAMVTALVTIDEHLQIPPK